MRRSSFSCVCLLFALAAFFGDPRIADAYTPESPEVQAMVRKGIGFIEQNAAGGYYSRLGGTCLVGMTIYKHCGDPNHPLVEAVGNFPQLFDKILGRNLPRQVFDLFPSRYVPAVNDVY